MDFEMHTHRFLVRLLFSRQKAFVTPNAPPRLPIQPLSSAMHLDATPRVPRATKLMIVCVPVMRPYGQCFPAPQFGRCSLSWSLTPVRGRVGRPCAAAASSGAPSAPSAVPAGQGARLADMLARGSLRGLGEPPG